MATNKLTPAEVVEAATKAAMKKQAAKKKSKKTSVKPAIPKKITKSKLPLEGQIYNGLLVGAQSGKLTEKQIKQGSPTMLATSLLTGLGLIPVKETALLLQKGGHVTVEKFGPEQTWNVLCWGPETAGPLSGVGLGTYAAEALLKGEQVADGGLAKWATAAIGQAIKIALDAMNKALVSPTYKVKTAQLNLDYVSDNDVALMGKFEAKQSFFKAAKKAGEAMGLSGHALTDFTKVVKQTADAVLKASAYWQQVLGQEDDIMAFPELSDAEMMTANTVPLHEAEKLYQPVRGTSTGSRYFAMGLHPSLKVAVRWNDHALAIRIEGPLLKVESAREELKAFGFSNTTSEYGSMHLNVGEVVLARKVLGSVLGGLSIQWPHVFPFIERIANKGK